MFFFNGKPYEQMDDLGVKTHIFGSTPRSAENGTAKDLFKDTCDAHLMGPQGLSTWRIGIKARPFFGRLVQAIVS